MTMEAIHSGSNPCTEYAAGSGKASLVDGLLNRLKQAFRNWRQLRDDRDAFDNLLALDDRMLADMGVTRDDVVWASRLPLSTNAALELKMLKASRKVGTD